MCHSSSKCCSEFKSRCPSIPAWILVLCQVASGLCFHLGLYAIYDMLTIPESASCWAVVPETYRVAHFIAPGMFFNLTAPLLGWISDTFIGREKAINLSVWSCWFGTLLQCISYCIQYGTCGLPVNIAKYGISSVALVFIIIGSTAYSTNVLAYGLDQLMDKPSAQIRPFVHWLVWGMIVSSVVGYLLHSSANNRVRYSLKIQIFAILTFFIFSLTLILKLRTGHKFEADNLLHKNPYKIILEVIKYAWNNKCPENRSALTYWENEIPSRIDLGKKKYGGPFPEEIVEDVKTFWRIVAMLLATAGFHIPIFLVIMSTGDYMQYLKDANSDNHSFWFWNAFYFGILIFIPLVELVIIPLFPKIEYFILNSLRMIGVAYILLLVSMLFMIIIDVIGNYQTPGEVTCPLTYFGYDHELNLSYLVYIIPLAPLSIVMTIGSVYVFEFICSQAPIYMSGILTGVY